MVYSYIFVEVIIISKLTIFIGDSFTQRMNTYGYINQVPNKVFAKAGTAPRDWYDKVGNDKFVSFADDIYNVKESDIERIIFLYGINDIKCSYDIYYGKRLVRELHMLFPNTPIYVQKVFPVATTYSWTDHTNVEMNREGYCVKQYNEEMEVYCSTLLNVHFIDTTDGFVTSYGNLKTGKTDDGLHISEAYYGDFWNNICKKTGMEDYMV